MVRRRAGRACTTGLNVQEYLGGRPQGPVLGLIFLRYVEVRFASKRTQLEFPSSLEAGRASAEKDGVWGVGYLERH